jgi:basic amino acid/polyamine antiporter, APA family
VLGALATVVAATLAGGTVDPGNLTPLTTGGVSGILQSAGLLFFAFAGYARIATLGEEVVDPARTIPRAIPLALGITLLVYAVVTVSALLAAGPEQLAQAEAPLAAAVEAGRLAVLSPAVRIGATVASLGVLLSLLAGVSRTTFAMARNRELPVALAHVHPRFRTPHRAELVAAVAIVAVVAAGDVRGAIGFSSFGVLGYYAVANAAAYTLTPAQRRWPRWIPAVGVVGCVVLAFSLPRSSVLTGAGVLGLGALAYAARKLITTRS